MKSLNDYVFEAGKETNPKAINICSKIALMKVIFSSGREDEEVLGYIKEMSKADEKSEQMENFYKYCKDKFGFDTDKSNIKDIINKAVSSTAKSLNKDYSNFINAKKKLEK